ncbi:MAG TPA: MFS transporter [Methylomirabilota bacterium]|nr:MFS transporter [Methylomirabilota bacterium]
MAVRPHTRRWLIVAALFVAIFGVSLPLAAYGVFLPVLAEHFGWTRGAVSAALSVNLLVGGVAGFAVGALADRHGPRVLLAATMALAGLGFALVSTVSALWHLYLLIGLVAGVGTSSFYVLGTATVSHWFDERRGLALALVLIGFNLGYITGGPAAAWLITRIGWRAAYLVLGGGCGLLATLVASSVRLPRPAERAALHRPAPPSTPRPEPGAAHGITLRQSLVDPRQWALNVSWLLVGGTAIMISVHAVPYARDQGVSLTGASLALTAYGLGSAMGRVVGGILSDRLGPRRTIAAAFLLQMTALAALLWIPSRAALLLSLMAFGAGFASSDTVVAQVVPQVFGLRALGAIMGILTLGWRCGAAIGPALAGFVYDLTGSYRLVFGLAPLGILVSWALFLLATARLHPRPAQT